MLYFPTNHSVKLNRREEHLWAHALNLMFGKLMKWNNGTNNRENLHLQNFSTPLRQSRNGKMSKESSLQSEWISRTARLAGEGIKTLSQSTTFILMSRDENYRICEIDLTTFAFNYIPLYEQYLKMEHSFPLVPGLSPIVEVLIFIIMCKETRYNNTQQHNNCSLGCSYTEKTSGFSLYFMHQGQILLWRRLWLLKAVTQNTGCLSVLPDVYYGWRTFCRRQIPAALRILWTCNM